jgi:hypothetical protein
MANRIKDTLAKLDRCITRPVWNIAGSVFVAIGVIGIFVPILPTTVFLLIAAACYNKGSEKFHHWLINNKLLGPYIASYRQKQGIPKSAKIRAIVLLWVTLSISAYVVARWHVTIILLAVAVGVTVFLLTRKTHKP